MFEPFPAAKSFVIASCQIALFAHGTATVGARPPDDSNAAVSVPRAAVAEVKTLDKKDFMIGTVDCGELRLSE